MAKGFFGADPLEGFLNTGLFALSRMNPSGNLLSNASSVIGGVAGQTFGEMDWDFDSEHPEIEHQQQIAAFAGGANNSMVDELGLQFGDEEASDPFAGVESLASALFNIANPFF